jgi:hypothetical protein
MVNYWEPYRNNKRNLSFEEALKFGYRRKVEISRILLSILATCWNLLFKYGDLPEYSFLVKIKKIMAFDVPLAWSISAPHMGRFFLLLITVLGGLLNKEADIFRLSKGYININLPSGYLKKTKELILVYY